MKLQFSGHDYKYAVEQMQGKSRIIHPEDRVRAGWS